MPVKAAPEVDYWTLQSFHSGIQTLTSLDYMILFHLVFQELHLSLLFVSTNKYTIVTSVSNNRITSNNCLLLVQYFYIGCRVCYLTLIHLSSSGNFIWETIAQRFKGICKFAYRSEQKSF